MLTMSVGRCYSCASSFGVFNKQLGCKNCGFGFCKKCLTKKIGVPKFGGEKAVVCSKCFDILSGKAQPVTIEPPEALTKLRLQTSSTQKPTQSQNIFSKPNAPAKGLSKEDAALADRLKNLKQDTKSSAAIPSVAEMESRVSKLKEERRSNIPSESQIAERLALVRDQDPTKATQPAVLKREPKKMQFEQVDDLLNEICQEVEIDSHGAAGSYSGINDLSQNDRTPKIKKCDTYNVSVDGNEKAADENSNLSDVNKLMLEMTKETELDAQKAMQDLAKEKELWDRVQRLKASRKGESGGQQNDKAQAENSTPDSDEDDEAATRRVIKQIMEENYLEEAEAESEIGYQSRDVKPSRSNDKTNRKRSESLSSEKTSDELPWCCICNNDAVLRCRGCDGDLYCQRCYREGHSREDIKDHRTIPYKKL